MDWAERRHLSALFDAPVDAYRECIGGPGADARERARVTANPALCERGRTAPPEFDPRPERHRGFLDGHGESVRQVYRERSDSGWANAEPERQRWMAFRDERSIDEPPTDETCHRPGQRGWYRNVGSADSIEAVRSG